MLRGQRRILLTMATGTGKTHTAFQLMWKLLKSGWLARRQSGRQGRMLFLADRVVLRDQAYNAFGAFAGSASDPRALLDGRKRLSLNRDVYFAIYQTLWNEEKDSMQKFCNLGGNCMDSTVQVRDRGVLTLPADLREKYGIRSGDTFRLVDLDGIFVLTPMVPMVPELAREIERARIEAGLSTDDLLRSLREQRERYRREQYDDAS
jgi:bifunctional DNA-binding transcriptional regulator/antitoxin component of YhaV-PrlF toxin-antitoxin module